MKALIATIALSASTLSMASYYEVCDMKVESVKQTHMAKLDGTVTDNRRGTFYGQFKVVETFNIRSHAGCHLKPGQTFELELATGANLQAEKFHYLRYDHVNGLTPQGVSFHTSWKKHQVKTLEGKLSLTEKPAFGFYKGYIIDATNLSTKVEVPRELIQRALQAEGKKVKIIASSRMESAGPMLPAFHELLTIYSIEAN